MLFKKINVNNLLLDLENPRYPSPPENQRQAIEFMLQLQGDKLLLLAQDIIDHGLDPSERLVVIEDDAGNYTVAEGNRRLTTLKLLRNINIVAEEKTTKKIKQLLASKPVIPKEVDCVVYSQDDERYEHWVLLKHTGENNGVGRVRWKGQETDRHRAKHGETSFANQLLSFVSKEETVLDKIKLGKRDLRVTNITRLIGDPDVRKRLSLIPIQSVLYCEAPKPEFTQKLNTLFEAMLEKDESGKVLFTVNRIRKKTDRKDFVDQLNIHTSPTRLESAWKVIEPDTYIEKTAQEKEASNSGEGSPKQPSDQPSSGNKPSETPATDDGDKTKGSDGTGKADDGDGSNTSGTSKPKGSKLNHNPMRNMLIPTGCKLNIPDKKCSGLFRELKSKLNFDEHEFSISVLIRVFLELSLSHYIEQHPEANPQNPKKTGLHDKVSSVAEHLRVTESISGSEATAVKSSSSGYFKAEGAGQQYVHNKYALPDRKSINTMWDNLEPLFKGIWK